MSAQNPGDDAPHPLPSRLIHDLRTPLNQIIGYSEMLTEQAQEAGNHEFASDLQKIGAAGEQLLALINNNLLPIRDSDLAGFVDEAQAKHPTPNQTTVAPSSTKPVESSLTQPFALSSTKPTSDAGSERLLVVDDIEANRDVLSRRLKRQGYTVSSAENGREALEMLGAGAFDLVLLDIMMPEMDGYETLARLKADAQLQHIPVIMISALHEVDSIVRCIELGAEDYLFKPFDPILLRARITASLDKKRARDREARLFEQLQQNYGRLQELEKQRDDLTNMIVHDLRTPLTSVIAGLQTLEVVGELNELQKEMMGLALGGGETLLGLINDLLDVEKLESGSMPLDYSVFSASELGDSAIAQVASLAEAKQLTLAHQINAHLPPLRGDENKLRRTLVNLLGNAIKFTPPGGMVTLAAHQHASEPSLVFSVSDTGEGIPLEAFDRIFEKFGQVESRQGGRVMSTGLGLSFCKLTVEAHGGHIEVSSVLGQGSTFRFTIPLAAPSELAPKSAQATPV